MIKSYKSFPTVEISTRILQITYKQIDIQKRSNLFISKFDQSIFFIKSHISFPTVEISTRILQITYKQIDIRKTVKSFPK